MKKSTFLGAVALSLLMPLAAMADYPERNIRLVVPFEPGGAGDVTSRIIAETANELLDGRKITIINRAGGGGIIGQTFVSRSKPDGYTLLAMTSSVVTNPTIKGASYSASDFRPIALYNFDPEVIAVAADSPYASVADFVAAANLETLNLVTAGVATAHHMAGLAIEQNTNLRFNYLPVRGFGKQLQTVMGGHADGGLWPLGEAATHVKAGSVRILAVAAETRDPQYPDVPTFAEAGLGVPVWATFRGWAVPAGTSDDVVKTLQELLRKVHESQAYKDKMTAAGYAPVFAGALEFQTIVDSYTQLTSEVIETHGLAK